MPENTKAAKKKRHQHFTESKLNKMLEYRQWLQEVLDMPRVPVSEASKSLIEYCSSTYDPMLSSIWGHVERSEDPYAPRGKKFLCCNIV